MTDIQVTLLTVVTILVVAAAVGIVAAALDAIRRKVLNEVRAFRRIKRRVVEESAKDLSYSDVYSLLVEIYDIATEVQ